MNDSRFGTLQGREDGWLVRFTRELHHPPEKVWRAITEPRELAQWFPSTVEGEWRPGAALTFRFDEAVGGIVMEGQVLVFDAPRCLEFTWGEDRLRFELAASADGTTVVFEVLMVERGKTARDGAGWHACLDWLELALAGRERDAQAEMRWAQVHPVYVELFGPESATIGPPQGHSAG